MTASASTSVTPSIDDSSRLVDAFGYADRLYKPAEIADLPEVAAIKQLCPACDTYTVVAAGQITESNVLEDTVTDRMEDFLSLTIEEQDGTIVRLEGAELKDLLYMSVRDAQDFVPCYAAAAKTCTHMGPFTNLEELRSAIGPVTVLSLACGSGECDNWTRLATGQLTISSEGAREFTVNDEEFSASVLDSPDYLVVTESNVPRPQGVNCVHS